MDYTVSLAVSFFVLPWLFLGVYPLFTSRLTPGALRRWFCTCIFYAAAFGLVLFFSYPFTHHLLQIPYLTVNAADYGQIALTKHIARGAFLKLIATYNNGNVYGAATLLVLPLFSLLEPRAWRRWAVRAALFLTLSRTIWAGLLAEQLLSLAPPLLSSLGTLPTLRLRGAGRQLLLIGGTALTILVVLFSASYSLSFLFDPTLSGRSGEFAAATQSTFLPSVPVTGFAEVLFASALITFGLLGCFAVLLVFFFPLLYAALRPAVFTMPIRRAALKGLVLYILISISDSATNLIPVMAFFWFVESVLLFGFPGTPESAAVRSPAPSLLIPVRRRLRRLLVPPEPAATPITPG